MEEEEHGSWNAWGHVLKTSEICQYQGKMRQGQIYNDSIRTSENPSTHKKNKTTGKNCQN